MASRACSPTSRRSARPFSCCLSCSRWRGPPPKTERPGAAAGLATPWQVMALASVAVPWLLYPFAGGHLADALTPGALFDALWPVLIGAALALVLRRWENRLPHLPAGDIVGAAETAFRASYIIGGGSG